MRLLPSLRRRRASRQLQRFESLEARLLLHIDPLTGLSTHDHSELATSAAVLTPTAATSTSTSTGTTAASVPVSSVPAYSSFVGAKATLYLDFDGHYEAQWGSYSNITTPVFDQDGDATTFSDGEQATIRAIWQQVAEDFAPFNVNVTTVVPSSFANGVGLRISIGGNGAWLGAQAGGVSYVGCFTNSLVNTSYVFTKNLSNGYAKYVAEAVSHEAGHAFWLNHQSQWNGTTKVNEYYGGAGDGRAPIMGNSYSATRGLWWSGTTTSATTYQNDMAVLAGSTNGFGYRTDDYGNTASTASALAVSGTQVSAAGVITTTTDVDYFSFTTGAGSITLSVNVVAYNNLDARLELRDAVGTLIAAAAPTTSFGATITATVAAGSYRLVVGSNGGYGDVGQYTVGGTIVSVSPLPTPSSLTAALSGGTVTLNWTDNSANETGFSVEKSTDGVNWQSLGQTVANVTTWSDTAVSAGGTYSYRVRAFNATLQSDSSNVASVTLAPVAPSNLTATPVSSSQIILSWSDVAGETGYRLQRSLDGVTWVTMGTVGAGVTSASHSNLAASTKYYYRVQAYNAGGDSPFSDVASATTLAASPIPAAPSNLKAVVVSAKRVDLTWTDNSTNESSFSFERSADGGRTWTNLGTVGANVTRASDTSVKPHTAYLYRMRAVNSSGASAYSNTASTATPGSFFGLFGDLPSGVSNDGPAPMNFIQGSTSGMASNAASDTGVSARAKGTEQSGLHAHRHGRRAAASASALDAVFAAHTRRRHR